MENLGRECTLMEIEPSYAGLFRALHAGPAAAILGTIKFPLERTRYYRNRCSTCQKSFDGNFCPQCGRLLTMGSRDRLEMIADREEPDLPSKSPPFCELLPLRYVLADIFEVKRESKSVSDWQARLFRALGHERFILTEATFEQIAEVGTPHLARAVVLQRTLPPGRLPTLTKDSPNEQLALDF